MSIYRFLPLLLMALSGCINPGNDIPEPDLCDGASSNGVDSIELGWPALSGTVESLEDGDVLPLVIGGQGTAMLELRHIVRGSNVRCVERSIEIVVPSGLVAISQERPLRVYEQDSGEFVSRSDFVFVDDDLNLGGVLLELSLRIGEHVDTASVWYGHQYDGPALVEPATSIEIPLGRERNLNLDLVEPAEEYTQAFIAIDAPMPATSVRGSSSFSPGETRTTVSLQGNALGTGTIHVGLGEQFYQIAFEVVDGS
ncbi:MAG: hypothetical protein GY811_06950 [Myxococcales bacterium]|nr:hypothetical protein [Myxococcales bacterium]